MTAAGTAATTPSLRVIPREDHPISRRNISANALKIISRLREAGHDSYLVGGGVRDLLIGRQPKDFDVATAATPEQVQALFGNSRLVGRRFRIVHVRFGREIIEVTTFRGHHDSAETEREAHANEAGMLLRDNVFGSLEDDAVRRDITINALYYCSDKGELLDHVGGMQDIDERVIRIIGDPATRYREDPVRMLRVLRFAAKLDFNIETNSDAALRELLPLLGEVAAARMFDELLKYFLGGAALASLNKLLEYDGLRVLFPATAEAMEADGDTDIELITAAMENTDIRIGEGKPVTPAFLYAVLLWPAVRQRYETLCSDELPEIPAMQEAAQQVLLQQRDRIVIPKRFALAMRDIWELQIRLARQKPGKRAETLLTHRYFRAGFDFLLLRERAGEIQPGGGSFWQEMQDTHGLPERKPAPERRKRPRRRRRRDNRGNE